MLRSIHRLACLFPVVLLSISMSAQQGATSQPNSGSGSSATAGQQPQAASPAPDAQNVPGQLQSLPDDPGAIAHVAAPVAPDGPTVVFDTSMGRMVCGLYSKEAPVTVANFVGLATGSKVWTNPATHRKVLHKPLYNGTTFHRVIPGFMIQGGDPLGTGNGDPGYYVNDEVTPDLIFDVAGRLAMANAGPNTNGSQFFITVAPQPSLDQHYSIFGQCDPASVLVAESITQVPRDSQDKPFDPVYLNKVTVVQPGRPLPPTPAPAASQTGPTTATHP